MSRKLIYNGPKPSGVCGVATMNTAGPAGEVVATRDAVVVRAGGKRALLLFWSDVVVALRWAMERSPELCRDVAAMAEEIEHARLASLAAVPPVPESPEAA